MIGNNSLQSQNGVYNSVFASPPAYLSSVGARVKRARETFEMQWTRRNGVSHNAVTASAKDDELLTSPATQLVMDTCHVDTLASLSSIEDGQTPLEKWGPVLGWIAVTLCVPATHLVTPPSNQHWISRGWSPLGSAVDTKEAAGNAAPTSPAAAPRIWFCGKRIRETRERAKIPIDTVVASVPNLSREEYKLIEACGCQEFEHWSLFLRELSVLTETPLFSLIVTV